MIRRELPLTTNASPAIGLSQISGRGFSFVLAPATADLVLELDCVVQGFAFSLVGKVFAFVFMRPVIVDKLARSLSQWPR